MSTKGIKAQVAGTEPPVAPDEAPDREPLQRVGEGIGVFRALLLTALFYVAFGFMIWFAWHAWRHWHRP
jgi:hypothetical protein